MVRGDKPIFIPVLFATPFHEGDKPGDSPIDWDAWRKSSKKEIEEK